MRDFSEERKAARAAVELLRQQPVMAEDFGAKPHSSQSACLEGVRTSEIYVGIFGTRYGYVAPTSKRSATEEEFLEARKCGLPMLCFVSGDEKDPDQQKFLDRVMAYEHGLNIACYHTPGDLKDKIVQGLHDLFGEPDLRSIDPAAATQHLESHQWGAFRPPPHAVSLGSLIFPARQREEYFSLRDLGSEDVQNGLLKDAMFATPALLPREHGVRTDDGEDHVVFYQRHEIHDVALRRLSIHTDGSIKFACILGHERRERDSVVRGFVIDQNEVKQEVETFLRYAASVYDQTKQSDLIANLYIGMSLSGIRDKGFGEIPEPEPRGLSMPSHNLDDPLHIPCQPLSVPRARLVAASSVSEELVEQIRRTFRAAGGEYHARAYNRW
jgi:hypothetical protein